MSKTITAPTDNGLEPDDSKVKLSGKNTQELGKLYPTQQEPEIRSEAEIQLDAEIKGNHDYDANLNRAIIAAYCFGALGVALYVFLTLCFEGANNTPAIISLLVKLSIFLPFIIAFITLKNASSRYLAAENFPQAQKEGFTRATILPMMIFRLAILSILTGISTMAPGRVAQLITQASSIFISIAIGSSMQYSFLSNRKIYFSHRLPIINTLIFLLIILASILPTVVSISDNPTIAYGLLSSALTVVAFCVIDHLCARVSLGWK